VLSSAGFAVIAAVGMMQVTVCHFFFCGLTDLRNLAGKEQLISGQGMVKIHGYGIDINVFHHTGKSVTLTVLHGYFVSDLHNVIIHPAVYQESL
jgi:hypothetical protein